MKTRIAVAVASLLVASLGATAYAQDSQMTPQQNMPHPSSMSHHMPMSNDSIPNKVKNELKAHGVTATDVTVTFQDGTATLSGTVASKRDITKAKSAAMRVKGVKHVDTSALQVKGHGG